MKPSEPLDIELARESSLFGKVIFVLATPASGSDVLMRALREFPQLAALPVRTNLFSGGMTRILDHWVQDGTNQGMHHVCGEEQEFLAAARLLADTPLLAARAAIGGDVVVEHSGDQIQLVDDIRAIYPDARIVHVVRDGRHVADRLAQGKHAVPARYAARRWVDDQRSAMEAAVDGTVKVEALLTDPVGAMKALADGLNIDAPGPALAAAASHFSGAGQLLATPVTGRAAAIVEIVAPDLLAHFGYELDKSRRSTRFAGWVEISASGAVVAAGKARRRVQERVADRFGRDEWRPSPLGEE